MRDCPPRHLGESFLSLPGPPPCHPEVLGEPSIPKPSLASSTLSHPSKPFPWRPNTHQQYFALYLLCQLHITKAITTRHKRSYNAGQLIHFPLYGSVMIQDPNRPHSSYANARYPHRLIPQNPVLPPRLMSPPSKYLPAYVHPNTLCPFRPQMHTSTSAPSLP